MKNPLCSGGSGCPTPTTSVVRLLRRVQHDARGNTTDTPDLVSRCLGPLTFPFDALTRSDVVAYAHLQLMSELPERCVHH